VGSVGFAWWISPSTFMHLLKENAVIVTAVAMTEICFLYFIAKNYRAVDPNYIKLTVIKALQKI
jgi:hypothetical protein